ncbi:MAG: HAD family hydrolase [Anaerolineae bacterium]|jgi:putative hydrolase of the HAD superfamily
MSKWANRQDANIQAIVFDFGGVLATFFRPERFRAMEEELGLEAGSLPRILWHTPDWRLAELGTIDDEAYWRRTAPRLGLDPRAEGAEARLRAFRQALFDDVAPDPAMVDLVRRLGRRYRLGLLSNTPAREPGPLLRRHGLEGLFDVVILSAAVGLAKPDPAIYHLALERLGTAPAATIFVDDYEPNVAAACELGLHGLHFSGYDALVAALEALGVDAAA